MSTRNSQEQRPIGVAYHGWCDKGVEIKPYPKQMTLTILWYRQHTKTTDLIRLWYFSHTASIIYRDWSLNAICLVKALPNTTSNHLKMIIGDEDIRLLLSSFFITTYLLGSVAHASNFSTGYTEVRGFLQVQGRTSLRHTLISYL